MINPFFALIIALLIVALALIVWPKLKVVNRWRRFRRMSARVLCEHALKHIGKAEVHGEHPTLQSVAGDLQISVNRAVDLLAEMERRRLIEFKEGQLRLTSSGQEYALHIIRAHRLWERYLADTTGLEEAEWHKQADRYEHLLSPAETGDLSSRLGNPSHDPHGDPIPVPGRDLMTHGGEPLAVAPVNQPVRIVHIEDEPETIYAQLVAETLYPGMEVKVLEKGPERIRFWADGEEHILAPILANNVSILPIPESFAKEPRVEERLSTLRPGQQARVSNISRACHWAERRRLLDLGFVPGTLVEAEMVSPTGDPVAYRVRGAHIALRREQASHIHVRRLEEVSEE